MNYNTFEPIIKILKNNFKINTACQIGLDDNISFLLADNFDYCMFYDFDSDFPHKVKKELDDVNTDFYLSDDLLKSIEYFDREYDFCYIHNRGSASFRRDCFTHMIRNHTKFILSHPNVITPSYPSHQVIRFYSSEGEYCLFYDDILLREVQKLNK